MTESKRDSRVAGIHLSEAARVDPEATLQYIDDHKAQVVPLTTYPVNNHYVTVQGEGVQTGVPMILLRLQGCPVGCPFCDTKETWYLSQDQRVEPERLVSKRSGETTWATMTGPQIVEHIKALYPAAIRWVMLTGGEPALYDLSDLVKSLHLAGYKIALETSGTATGHVGLPIDWVTVSPKIDMPGGRPIVDAALRSADEIKMVIGKSSDLVKLEELLETDGLKKDVQICLQPMSQSPKATAICVDTCLWKGWRLSIQTHKLIHLD